MEQRKRWLRQCLEQIDDFSCQHSAVKHQKMASTPFLFFRGSASLFYADIAQGQLKIPPPLLGIPLTCVVGDCHTSNFGFITEEGSHGDKVVFTVNDFDDACIGHAVWDLARFITSLSLCAKHCQGLVSGKYASDKPVTGKPCVSSQQVALAAQAFIQSYIDTCQSCISDANMRYQALSEFPAGHILAKRYLKACARASEGDKFRRESTLAKAVEPQSLSLKFKIDADKFTPLPDNDYRQVKETFAPYVDDEILDIVMRINAGTSSVNMSRYYLLVGPKDADLSALALCHIVEVKQQRTAAPLHYFNGLSAINRLNPAHLTVNCQRRMQRSPDLVLDELAWRGQHWLVRSRHHAKVGIKPEHIATGKKATLKSGFVQYAKDCGTALALAHCRGDRRSTLFEQSVCRLLPFHQKALIGACLIYAEQVIADTELLIDMLND